jgi:hypothetical protein
MRPLGLKPALILETLRGAEAPLFHGAARIRARCYPHSQFFRGISRIQVSSYQ